LISDAATPAVKPILVIDDISSELGVGKEETGKGGENSRSVLSPFRNFLGVTGCFFSKTLDGHLLIFQEFPE
jgi:hypothetical protein